MTRGNSFPAPTKNLMDPVLVHRRTHGTSTLSSCRDILFVVNPRGAGGRTGDEWKKLLPYLRARLPNTCNIRESLTSGPRHAISITREAIMEGVGAVVAVGGDGTLHEVVNGFFCDGKPLAVDANGEPGHPPALGLIPLGTGSDFARTLGWKNDPQEAIDRIAEGGRSPIDVGVIQGEDEEECVFFINVADVHLSAKAGFYASKYKKFGNLCYVMGALQAFVGHKNQDLRVKVCLMEVTGNCSPELQPSVFGNGRYFGGGMKITPNANPRSGSLEVVILRDFKWYHFVLNLYKLYNGTHLALKNVSSRRVISVQVSQRDAIFVQSDGEHLGFLPRKFSILPSAIDMFC